jgi:hypothetical protein
MALDGDEVVRRSRRVFGEVSVQFVERLTADPTVAAVLEQQNWTVTRLGNGGVERSDIDKRVQFHQGMQSL